MNPPSHRILIIDDNQAIHQDYAKILLPASESAANLASVEDALFGEVSPKSKVKGLKSKDSLSAMSPTLDIGLGTLDSPPLADGVRGYQLDFAFQGEEGLGLLRAARQANRPYALAFIDGRMPPGWDGVETIAHLWRDDPDLQVVLCTAYSDHSLDEILNRLGHSDRLVILKKPFEAIEVLQLTHALTEKWRMLQQVREKTQDLERRVVDRTHALESANEKLRAEIVERQQAEENFRQAQKMEAIGQLAGGVAHDFNNMLTVIRGYANCLLQDPGLDLKHRGPLQQMDGAAERATNLTRQLLAFSRKQVLQPEPLNLGEVVQVISKMLRRILGEDIALEIEVARDLSGVFADRAMIEQVLLNLVVNARDAMPRGGRLLVRATDVKFNTNSAPPTARGRVGEFVNLTVSDSGCGIAPEVLPRIFEPFFTTKEVGKGTGLGLATVYGIVKQHEGWIEVESPPGAGAVFQLFFPACARPVPAAPASGPAAKIPGGKEAIFLVEDEPALRGLTCTLLQRCGYRVIAAASGVDALRVWPDHAANVDLLLTDMVMPGGVSGRDLALRLQAEKSGLKVIYTSGYSTNFPGMDAPLPTGENFLPKPFTAEKLAHLVRNCLDGEPRALATAT